MSSTKHAVILTIDDEENIRTSFRNFLEDCDYKVLEAANGKAGLQLFDKHGPDLVLVDLRMPELDGIEVLRQIRAKSPDTPVIVVSGTGVINDAVDALHLGAWDFILKPIEDLTVLLHIVRKSLERAQLIKENRQYQVHLEEMVEIKTRELKKEFKERAKAEVKIQKLSSAVEQSPTMVMITDAQGTIEYVNPVVSTITGYSMQELIGNTPRVLQSGCTPHGLYEELWETITSGQEWHGEICNKKKDGELYWEYLSVAPIKDAKNQIVNFLAIKEDVTFRKEYEMRIEHQANYDALTDLPNRVLALDRLSQALERAKREKAIVAVMFVDLDQFKFVNDTLGHAAGDQLLVEASARLLGAVRSSDTIARLGGDEFLVILPEIDTIVHAEMVARKIIKAFSKAFLIQEQEFFITASIGITIYPNDGKDADILLRNADAAMYRAKDESRNTFRFFMREMNERSAKRLQMESLLRHALERGELFLCYQPLIDIPTGKLLGMEALLRWKNKGIGMIMPDRFIPLAEETGLIVPIGSWVIKTACKQAMAWQKEFKTPLRISVNVSARQFKTSELLNAVETGLDKSNGLDPDLLELEITEGVLMQDAPKTRELLNHIGDMGVRLSIDDFGTGYSALGYLKKYSFDTLKIDRSFTCDMLKDPQTGALTSAIISIAHNLGLTVVAEGVETKEQLKHFKQLKCDIAQGYYFSKPLTTEDFGEYLKTTLKKKK